MGLLVINIEGIWGGGGVVTFKGNIRNKFTGLETGGEGVVREWVYIINRAKGKGAV